jgi:hypothetical protein
MLVGLTFPDLTASIQFYMIGAQVFRQPNSLGFFFLSDLLRISESENSGLLESSELFSTGRWKLGLYEIFNLN